MLSTCYFEVGKSCCLSLHFLKLYFYVIDRNLHYGNTPRTLCIFLYYTLMTLPIKRPFNNVAMS